MILTNSNHFGRLGSDRRRGSAAVEFALIAPFFVLISLGMFELGRAMMVKTSLSDAASKGCRAGILRQNGNASTTWVTPFYLGSAATLESETVIMMKQ